MSFVQVIRSDCPGETILVQSPLYDRHEYPVSITVDNIGASCGIVLTRAQTKQLIKTLKRCLEED